MYGSSLSRRTLSPRASRIAPRQAEVIPLPSEDTTPPVMKMNRVMSKPGGPGAASRGSHRPAVEVERLVHRRRYCRLLKVTVSHQPHDACPSRAVRNPG